jgi:cyclic beta-1,2-glucan synthetase
VGQTIRQAILVGYFAKKDEAQKAIRELAQRGFRRTALIQKGTEGDIHIKDPFLRRRALRLTLAAILSGGGGGLASLCLHWSLSLFFWNIPTVLMVILVCAGVGGLVASALFRRSGFGIEQKIMRDHARWLMPDEFALILQAPLDFLQRPVALLREGGDIHPALFVMHPRHERRAEARGPAVKLSPAQILEHSRRHAAEQQVDPEPQHTVELLNRLKQSRKWIRQVCADLTAASRLEQKATPAADWILDNE